MKNKNKWKVAVVIAAALCVAAGSVYALSAAREASLKDVQTLQTDTLMAETAANAQRAISSRQAHVTALLTAEDMPATESDYYRLVDWAAFLAKYEFTDEQLAAFDALLARGITPYTIMDAYAFWRTTNEDFSLVTQLAEQEDAFIGANWIENVFNDLTDNKTGVLELEDVREYIERGLTQEDIATANILCRKGVMTIQEILEQRLSGADWATLTEACQPKKPGLFRAKRVVKGNFESGTMQLAAVEAAQQYDVDVTAMPEEAAAEQLRQLEQTAAEARQEAAQAAVAALGVDKAQMIRTTEEQEEADRAAAMENGFGKPIISMLLHRGFSYAEIRAASALCLADDSLTPTAAAKQARAEKEVR